MNDILEIVDEYYDVSLNIIWVVYWKLGIKFEICIIKLFYIKNNIYMSKIIIIVCEILNIFKMWCECSLK